MLFASRLEPLLSAAESQDVTLVPKILEWFRANLNEPDAATLGLVEREAGRLLRGDVRGQAESEDHVHIVSAVAQILGVREESSMIADGNWKQGAWDTYFERIEDVIDSGTSLQFGHLVQCTRPVFGASISTSWAYYGYLFRREAAELLAGLNAAAAAHPEIASSTFIDGFHNELSGWVQQALDRRTDLWLFAS
jgi:hypothetical protein